MIKKKSAVVAAVLVIAVAVAVAAVASQPARDELYSPDSPAEFTVSNLTVSPQEVQPGGIVTVTVEVHNAGDEQGTHALKLIVDGQVEQSRSVTLGGGEASSISFPVEREAEGAYSVASSCQAQLITLQHR